MRRAKATILAEARGQARGPERWLRAVLDEAEAEAWQTGFPQLIFPTLAWERVQAGPGRVRRRMI